jgi:hypothetical protein
MTTREDDRPDGMVGRPSDGPTRSTQEDDGRRRSRRRRVHGVVVAGLRSGQRRRGQPIGPGLDDTSADRQIVNDKRNATWTITAPNRRVFVGRVQVASYGTLNT